MTRRAGSLRARLVVSGLLGTAIAAAAVAGLLGAAFERSVLGAFERRLTDDLLTVVGQVTADGDGTVRLRGEPLDTRYARVFSGHYWVVRQGRREFRSRSLWDASLALPDAVGGTTGGIGFTDIDGPTDQRLRAAFQAIRIPGVAGPALVLVASDVQSTRQEIGRFRLMAGIAGALVAAALMFALVAQTLYGLRPLRRITRALESLRRGDTARLESDRFPQEIAPLAEELNGLLAYHQRMVARARDGVSDLAHSLKTPLSVLLAAAGQSDPKLPALVRDQVAQMKASMDRHLSLATPGDRHDRTAVAEVADALIDMFRKLYAERGLDMQALVDERLLFHGSRADLEEMLGNLLDNACKWARGRVMVTGSIDEGRLRLVVADDGPGIDSQARTRVLKRGVRLDERQSGSGLGLAIVSALTESYEGVVDMGPAEGLFGVTLLLPGSMDSAA